MARKILAQKKEIMYFPGKLRYKVCVSGGADTSHCVKDALEKAEELGKEIARNELVLVTPAITGVPYWAAKGAKEVGGIVIGISPAKNKTEHLKTYRLPIDYHDLIIYTGFDYSGRNLLLIRSSDAFITLCGRMGTLNEFTIAFEDEKPIGVLKGTGGTSDMIENMVQTAHRGPGKIAYDADPASLVQKVLQMIGDEEKKNGVKDRRFF